MIINSKSINISEKYYNDITDLYNNFSKIDKNIITIDFVRNYYNNLERNHNIFFFILDEKIVGIITLLIEQKLIHNGKSVGHIEDLVVLDLYRNKNIATKLIDYIIEYSKNNNCYKIILDCDIKLETFYIKKSFINKGLYMANYF